MPLIALRHSLARLPLALLSACGATLILGLSWKCVTKVRIDAELIVALDGHDSLLARHLIANGADPNARMVPQRNGPVSFLQRLEEVIDPARRDSASVHGGRTALMIAAGNGDLDTVNALLRRGADVTKRGNFDVGVMLCAMLGHADFCATTGTLTGTSPLSKATVKRRDQDYLAVIDALGHAGANE